MTDEPRMDYEITEAYAHRDHTVTVTWSDGARAEIGFAPYLEKGGVFEALKDPDYFVREMRVLRDGVGVTWPNGADFSADGLRQDAQAISYPTLYGEEWMTALLLALVIEHCGGFSPEKRRSMTSYFSPDPSPGQWLDSYNITANADAMQELEGLIEIVEQDGAHIVAKVTPQGRALLGQFRAQQKRDREREAEP